MENKNTTKVKPEIYFLQGVLKNIAQGILRVPNFQRPFVWKPEDMIALFESIANGYPIGSLLFWKADQECQSLPHVGPYKIPENNSLPINYILDGHQRLSTLYGILTSSTNQNQSSIYDWRWTIYYDLEKDSFLHFKKDNPPAHYIALYTLLKTVDFLKECRRIETKLPEKANLYIEKAERLAQSIREYQIAITQIEGGDLASAVNIFARLNSKGRDISEDRMYSALTYREGQGSFNLASRIDAILDQLKDYNFSGINRLTIFKSILVAAEKSISTKGRLSALNDIDNLPSVVNMAEKSILEAVKFLYEELKVPSYKLLPYPLQLILLSEFFRKCPSPKKQQLQQLKQWFWVSSFAGLETTNSYKINLTIEEIRSFAQDTSSQFLFKQVNFQEEARPFPENFGLHSSRVRVYVLFLLSLNPQPLDSSTKRDIFQDLGNYGHEAITYIISGGNRFTTLGHKLSNRILLGKVTANYTRRMLEQSNSLFPISQKVLDSHAITKEVLQAFYKKDYDKFLKLREQRLIELERDFMLKIGVKPSTYLEAQEAIIDTE